MQLPFFTSRQQIRSWKAFYRAAASSGVPLLRELPRFPGSVLVAGCQRSGTTALSRVIAGSDGFTRFRISHDDELDAALILAGFEGYRSPDRHCFQTTYLNAYYSEYLDNRYDFRLVWVIRNPHSIVHSMTYHWRRAALDRLFESCGRNAANDFYGNGESSISRRRLSRIEKACFSYVGKSVQLVEIAAALSSDRLMVIDYDQLCVTPDPVLRSLFRFIDAPYRQQYAQGISSASLAKSTGFSEKESALVEERCRSTYDIVSSYVNLVPTARG